MKSSPSFFADLATPDGRRLLDAKALVRMYRAEARETGALSKLALMMGAPEGKGLQEERDARDLEDGGPPGEHEGPVVGAAGGRGAAPAGPQRRAEGGWELPCPIGARAAYSNGQTTIAAWAKTAERQGPRGDTVLAAACGEQSTNLRGKGVALRCGWAGGRIADNDVAATEQTPTRVAVGDEESQWGSKSILRVPPPTASQPPPCTLQRLPHPQGRRHKSLRALRVCVLGFSASTGTSTTRL